MYIFSTKRNTKISPYIYFGIKYDLLNNYSYLRNGMILVLSHGNDLTHQRHGQIRMHYLRMGI